MAAVSRHDAARLRAELLHEIDNLAEAARKIARLGPARDETTTYAIALLLMNYYTGAEHLLRRVGALLGGLPPAGERWHQQLLDDMQLEIEGVRPAVLSAPTGEAFGQMLRFRHVLRNLYAWSLRRTDIDGLVEQLGETHGRFEVELRTFAEFLALLAAG